MRSPIIVLVLLVLLLLGVVASFWAPLLLLFGWIPFLARVLPKVTVDGPSLVLGGVALGLFVAGVQWAGRSWLRRRPAGEATRQWRFRWSLILVAGFCLLFAAGIAVVGVAHQVVWMVTRDRPRAEEVTRLRLKTSSPTNMKQIVVSLIDTADSHEGTLPPGGSFTPEGTMLHSWETYTLPYIAYDTRGIDLKRPWNDPKNRTYFRCVLPEFINPRIPSRALKDEEGYGLSHYAANSHVMGANTQMKLSRISDGTSQTILVGEVNANFKPWGHPVNWRDPAKGVNRSPYGFGGAPGAGGANFAFADGSVRFVNDKVNPAVLRALATPRGGEIIDVDEVAPSRGR